MANSRRTLQDTIRTAGYHADINDAGVINIYTPTNKLALTGYLTTTGKLTLTSHQLKRVITNTSELSHALDELNGHTP